MDFDKVFILGITAVLALAVVLLFYIDRKFPKKEPKPDPITKSLFLTFALIFMVYMGVLFDVWTKEQVREYWWLFFAFFAACLIIFTLVAKRRDPLPPDKLMAIAERWVDKFMRAERVIDKSSFYDLNGLSVQVDHNIKEGDDRNKFKWSCEIYRKVKGQTIKFFVTLDQYYGTLLQLIPNPSIHLTQGIQDREAPSVKMGSAEDWGVEEGGEE